MTLDKAPTGVTLTILGTRGRTVQGHRRQAEMGIRPGAVLRILTRTAGGGAILAIGDDRIAVSRSILRTVRVEEPDAQARDGGAATRQEPGSAAPRG
ncbi:MAG: FeoA family protein [Candidatus Nanopelagicales bacterium]